MHIRPVHPFPARMAPDLALEPLSALRPGSRVLDPMAGSGTVLRQAVELGHHALGFDLDPLAVLMARVWTTGVEKADILREHRNLVKEAMKVDLRTQKLPWVVDDPDTESFIRYWFADSQRRAISRLAYVLYVRRGERLSPKRRAAIDALRVALSRIIITKDQGASLARDASHSRPHRVATDSDYDVFEGLARSVAAVTDRTVEKPKGTSEVRIGDARNIPIEASTVDAVLTSPPYLNAIDYMRGHRLSLVWLGYRLKDLRAIRGHSIGSEKGLSVTDTRIRQVSLSMTPKAQLPPRLNSMVDRYAADLTKMALEVARVLKRNGEAVFVVGNSCLRGVFVRNSDGVRTACNLAGLSTVDIKERDLPANNRYLPITDSGSLSKRMRTETVLTFRK